MKPALYIAYVSGVGGSSLILFYLSDTLVAGVDAGTGKYVGKAQPTPGGGLKGNITLTAPAGQPLITGAPPLEKPVDIPVSFELPPGFEKGESVISVTTPLGTVNARFEKMMELE